MYPLPVLAQVVDAKADVDPATIPIRATKIINDFFILFSFFNLLSKRKKNENIPKELITAIKRKG